MSRTKRKTLAVMIASMWLAAGSYALAAEKTFESGETQTSLLELFTSEGCSSCPPAEKWLSSFKSNPDLWTKTVPIAFHVDYWDHLGWRDRFAKPDFTQRQRHYAAAWGGDSVYTPGFAVNGREWRGWFGVGGGLRSSSEKIGKLGVTLSGDGKVAAIFVPTAASNPRLLKFEVALLGNDLESEVKRGENSGRKLRHDFVVLGIATTDMTKENDRWTASVQLPSSGDDKPGALAAWITENAIPIQATGGWLR